MPNSRTNTYFDALDRREKNLALILVDPTFTGSKQEASLAAGYVRTKTVFDKLRLANFQNAMLELGDQMQRQIMATNIAKRQRIMDELYKVIEKSDTSPLDKARCAETWGKFEGTIGTGGTTIYNNLKQIGGGQSSETLEDAVRRVSGERWDRVVSKDKD